jgi:addiction module HigA family antidote
MRYEITPLGVLIEETLEDMDLGKGELAERMGVAPTVISDLIYGRRGLSDEMASKLDAATARPAGSWASLNHHIKHRLQVAEAGAASEISAAITAAVASRREANDRVERLAREAASVGMDPTEIARLVG